MPESSEKEILDDFRDISGWSAIASGEAQLTLSSAAAPFGRALRMDFAFRGRYGFVVARKAFPLELPQSYSFTFFIRGKAPANSFEFKLVDASGQNVWRWRQEALALSKDFQPIRIRSSQIEFAWGPLGGGLPQRIAALEIAIVAGPGGKGMVEIADLRLRDETYRGVPVVQASSALPGHAPDSVVGAAEDASWRSLPGEPQWLLLDFGQVREYGGLVIRWEEGLQALGFKVQLSTDGAVWKTAYATHQGGARCSYVYLPQACSRYLRLNLHRSLGQGFGIRRIEVKPLEFSRCLNAFFASIAREWPPGWYPKYLLGRQSYWTTLGSGEGEAQALFNEEGMVEVDKGSFSIEPFLYLDGRLLTWAEGGLTQGLEQGYLPIPWVEWRVGGLVVKITAFVGPAQGSAPACLYLRFGIENSLQKHRSVCLFAAIRPFQVTPTWQHWRAFGGVAEVRELSFEDGEVRVNRNRRVVPLSPPSGFGAAAFAQGAVTEYLAEGLLPPHLEVTDEFGYASGALRFDLNLAPGAAEEIWLGMPFGPAPPDRPKPNLTPFPRRSGDGEREARARLEHAVRTWQATLGAVDICLPSRAQGIVNAFKTAAAHILINRTGPALHPGPRRYDRAWIRDGVMMGAALLRVGITEPLRDFIGWYARFQAEDGRLPDCVDHKGAEWLPEFDAYGQFLYGIMEYWRFTGDTGFVREMQPQVKKTLVCLEALRARRLTPEYQLPERRACYGLLPESMSHEGYMAHPVHAYWDDFWALRGLKDAQVWAEILGDRLDAERLQALRDEFCRNVHASLEAAMARHGIDYLPASVELGDFDPAATAVAFALDADGCLPKAASERTFDKYLEGLKRRVQDRGSWTNYSAYEIRIAAALVRLGRRLDALELLGYLLADRRIRPWNQWPEISWRDPLAPCFLGDLPHTWISAEYILAVRSLFAYEREADGALVIAAGVPEDWLAEGQMVVQGLPTWYGKLSYTLRREEPATLHLAVGGGITVPPGGIVVRPPLAGPIVQVEGDTAKVAEFGAQACTLREIPADITLTSSPP